MESAFAWLQNVTEWLGRFFPRWTILDPTLAWLKFHGNGEVETGRGGWVYWWPITTKCEIHSVAEQTIKLEPQSITTRDGKEVTVRGAIVYEYVDIERMGTLTIDPDDAVRDKVLMVIFEACIQHTKDQLLDSARDKALDRRMLKRAQALLRPYGVRVIRLGLIELSGARPYRVIGTGSNDMAIPMPMGVM